MKLSLVVPSYNEKEYIGKTIEVLYSYLRGLKIPFELIVGDDGSTDGEIEIIKEYAKKYREVIFVRYEKNQGKGKILTECFKVAHGGIQAFIDADLTIDTAALKPMVALIMEGQADVAIASKHIKGAKLAYPFLRILPSKMFALLTRTVFKLPFHDFQCGLKAFDKKVIDSILPKMTSKGWIWDTEMIVRTSMAGFRIVEVPATVNVEPEGRISKVKVIRDMFAMAKSLFKLRKNLKQESAKESLLNNK